MSERESARDDRSFLYGLPFLLIVTIASGLLAELIAMALGASP